MSNKVFVGNQAVGLETSPAFEPFRAVKLWFDDDRNYFSGIVVSDSGEETSYHSESEWNKAGGTGRVMEEECRWATQTMADNVLKNIKGYVYKPFLGSGALLNQAAELGDGVTIGGTYGLLAAINTTFDAMCTSDIESPADEEIDHEYPYLSPEDRALKRKVTLGESYYGTRITRAKGIESIRIDADGNELARAVFNADELAFYAGNERALYFDIETKRYMYVGDIYVKGNINMSEGTITWGKNNPADGSGISASEARTIISEELVSSPTIIGGAYWSHDENTKLDLLDVNETELGFGSGMILYRNGGGMPIFSVAATVLVTEFRGYNNNEFLKVDASRTRPQGKWNFSEADEVTGLYLRFS